MSLPPTPSAAFAVFRPWRGRWVATGFAVSSLVVFGVLALAVPATGLAGWGVTDSLLMFGVGVLIAALMWRFRTIEARPTPAGLTVRNLLLTRTVVWADVERLRFGEHEAWAWLDLRDGEELAVMAIQRADGLRARLSAARLEALLETRGGTLRPPAS